ncbi:MAG: GNAT family N-acetyltransferase [Candidatus Thorarchaeota archaeon]
MIEFEMMEINEVNVDEISQLLLDVKTSNGEWSEEVDLERVKQVFLRNFENTEDLVLLARQVGRLIGLIVIHFDQQDTIEMNPWFLNGHPIVHQEFEKAQLESRMIQRVKEYAEANAIVRVNVHFMKDGCHLPGFYEELGMFLLEEVTHLRAVLSELEILTAQPTDEVDIIPLHEAQIENLYDCWYESFRTGQDRSFFNRPREQNRAHFDEMFDKEEYDNLASIALRKGERIVGFALVKHTHGEKNGHLWELGVHPDFKRRGFAKMMLGAVRRRLLQEEMKTLSLNCDRSNDPAFKLYQSYNFSEEWTQVGYTWMPEP